MYCVTNLNIKPSIQQQSAKYSVISNFNIVLKKFGFDPLSNNRIQSIRVRHYLVSTFVILNIATRVEIRWHYFWEDPSPILMTSLFAGLTLFLRFLVGIINFYFLTFIYFILWSTLDNFSNFNWKGSSHLLRANLLLKRLINRRRYIIWFSS